jgi:hypothetical protein
LLFETLLLLSKLHHPRSDSDNLSSFQESVEAATETFYNAVGEQKSIKHFLFGITLDKIYENMKIHGDFVVLKPDEYYRDVISQTAPSNLQVTPNQFEDIYKLFARCTEKAKISKKANPQACQLRH